MQPAEKQEFIQYLEKGGVIDVLTKAFVTLYEQNNSGGRPEDPMEFMKKSCLGAGESRPAAELEKENEELKNRIKELEAKVASLEESKKE
mmetsp:Transcript_1482/g.1890  ORF Transcript_1482/g.1890 Transcript_1482/m.1890 type:complete len:90 (-) Transcript_1482:1138-1407(-)